MEIMPMNDLEWLLVAVILYWALVWLWIAGTSPLAGDTVTFVWKLASIILKALVFGLLLCVFMGSTDNRRGKL
jgi:hypothetical protein